ncbi:MAG: bifunctional metallophosphatase/5'-nucleotidase [Clostridia bacterium]|nr:bifunctional metallophosphatase/5'-nucleotidase [Clostridia bacterium]
MKKTFHIRFTSDMHGYFLPTNYRSTQELEMGLLRLCPDFPHDGNTLLLDGGDTLQGSPLTTYYERLNPGAKRRQLTDQSYGYHPVAAMMNLAGYQYITLGNHDFNYGLDELSVYLGQLRATCLLANVRDRAHQLPIRRSAIHTLENGLRIGLTGITCPRIRVWEKAETVAQLEIEDAFDVAREVYEELRDQCDFTVLIYHGGYERDLNTHRLLSGDSENQACQICEEIGYDLVLTGHQHIAQAGMTYGHSYTVQPPDQATMACAVEVTLDNGRKTYTSTLLPATAPVSPAGVRILQPLEAKVQEWLDMPAGHLDRPIPFVPHLESALHGSLVANFINTVQRSLSGAQVSATALPNTYKGFTADPTIRDIVSTYVYANTLVVLSISGADLKAYIEHTAEYFELTPDGHIGLSELFMRPKVQHYNYDYFSGIDYTIDVRRPAGDRVTRMEIDGRPVSMEERVTLCINSYRFSGTSDYDMLPGQPVVQDIQVDVANAIIAYLLDHNHVTVDTHRWSQILPAEE